MYLCRCGVVKFVDEFDRGKNKTKFNKQSTEELKKKQNKDHKHNQTQAFIYMYIEKRPKSLHCAIHAMFNTHPRQKVPLFGVVLILTRETGAFNWKFLHKALFLST